METCLAMTIFREEFNVGFVAMFTVLTFIKVFHWLVQDRVDFIETTPSVSRMNHLRIISFRFLLLMGFAFLHLLNLFLESL
jgi:E3 ubiquitin-protein ligase synoviolin